MAIQFGGDGEKFGADVKLAVKHVGSAVVWDGGHHLIRNSTKGGGNASQLSEAVVPTWPVVEDGIQHGLSSG